MSNKKLYFARLKEIRGRYYVEYSPPISGYRFANLQLIYTCKVGIGNIAKDMELEAEHWLALYPIPIMVSAFSEAGVLHSMQTVKPENHLIAFFGVDNKTIEYHWRLLKDDQIPAEALNQKHLLKVYKNLERKTSADLKKELQQHAKKLRIGWFIIFIWAVIIPAVVSLLEFFSPQWIAILVLICSLSMALIKALKLLGLWKKSPKESIMDEEKQRMKHHHYHCEENP